MTFDANAAAGEAVRHERAHRILPWPGDASTQVALVVLTRKEIEQASIEVARYVRKTLKLDPIDLALIEADNLLGNERIVQTLAAALRRPDCIEVRAYEADALRKSITSEEQIALIQAYNAFERERSPLSKSADAEALLDEVIRLGKPEAQWTWATYCEPDTLRDIVTCAVRRLTPPTSETSSAT
ncbi:MAG: hypothetical protein EKK55_10215 [Rhodocyclaceae bacterium]|nr:MAG: hypothetical protein EKK55_10215 [Rhodocyclaceae bacterium]